jgi:VCBS repeat-containing protein
MNKKAVLLIHAALLAALLLAISTIAPSWVSARTTNAFDDAYTVNEDTALSVSAPGVLSNDGDAPLTALLASGPSNGSLTLNDDGSFIYAPYQNFSGMDSFTYYAADGAGNQSAAMALIAVNAVNDPPAAVMDAYSTVDNATLSVAFDNGILQNDVDPDSSSLSAVLVADAAHGDLTLSSNGAFSYTPAANSGSSDSFAYRATDGAAESGVAIVNISVNDHNDPPVAYDQDVTTGEDTPKPITLVGTDPDGDDDDLDYIIVDGPDHGTLSGFESNQTYTPAANYNGSDSFTFKVDDGDEDSNEATVTITVTAVNDKPIANNHSASTLEDTALNFTIGGFDQEGDSLTYTITSNPAQGVLSGAPPNLTYTPTANYAGSDAFKFKVSDGLAESDEATVSITVSPVNDPPVAVNDAYDAVENTTFTASSANGVLQNDTDLDSSSLSAKLNSGPTNGVLTLNPNGSFNYAPNANFSGVDSFTYVTSDALADSNVATVTITVIPDNNAPTALGQNVTAFEETPVSFILAGSDPENDPLTFTVLSNPNHGTLTGVAPNLTYTPAPNYVGPDTFTFKVADGELESNVATITIEVISINDPPVLDLNGEGPGAGFTAVVAAGGSARAIVDKDLDITDADGSTIWSATVDIENRKHGAKEILSADESDPDIAVSLTADGDLRLEGEDSIADYEKVLRSVKYRIAPDVATVDKEDRQIVFKVYDGVDYSAVAASIVDVIAPSISITISDEEQPVPKGSPVEFLVKVTNTGDVDLKNVVVNADLACDKSYALIAAGASKSYTCDLNNIQTRIDNEVVVTAKDVKTDTEVTDADTGTVLVIPDVGIIIVPDISTGDVLIKGDDAVFTIIVENPSLDATLENVKVVTSLDYETRANPAVPTEPVATPCDLDVGTLPPGKKHIYSCTVPDVPASFSIEAVATAKIEGLFPTTNYDSATVGVIDLIFEVLSDPFEIPAGQAAKVTFNLSLQNTSSVPLVLTGLSSAVHGDLLDDNNPVSGGCANLQGENIPANKSITCSYEVLLTLQPPVFSNELTAVVSAAVAGGGTKELSIVDEAFVSLNDFSPLAVVVSANPRSLVAPGGQANLTVQVTNQMPVALTLDALTDSVVGSVNGKGNCVLPRLIPGGGTYSCVYPVTISGRQPGDVATHQITAEADARQASNLVNIPITAEPTTYVMLPAISKGAVAGEPNDSLCAAVPLMTNLSHYFFADDDRDWYRFTLTSPAQVKVKLSNFIVTDGQLVIYTADSCVGVSGNPIGHNGEQYQPIRELDLGQRPAGTYFILVVAEAGFSSTTPYILRIEATEP